MQVGSVKGDQTATDLFVALRASPGPRFRRSVATVNQVWVVTIFDPADHSIDVSAWSSEERAQDYVVERFAEFDDIGDLECFDGIKVRIESCIVDPPNNDDDVRDHLDTMR